MNPANTQESPVALITGAARRVGAAIAMYLQIAGFRVVVHYHRSEKEARGLVDKLNSLRKDSALALGADITCKKESEQLVSQAFLWGRRLDLLVNNAAIFIRTTAASSLDETVWNKLFKTNVQAPFWLSHTAYAYLAEHKGSIVNITDIHADKPLKEYSVYCQSKAAFAMQTKSLAREFAPNVRVNAVAPGAIAWPEKDNVLSAEQQQHILEYTPLRQHGDPVFVAEAVLSLAQNRFITGQTLCVDGGRSLR